MSRLRVCALALALAATLPGCVSFRLEDRTWVSIDTEGFQITSSLSVSETVELARKLERFRVMMGVLTNTGQVRAPVPTRIYAFATRFGYRRFVENESIAGLYYPTPRANYVAMVKTRGLPTPESVLYHEYVHFVLHNHATQKFPPWFDEGFAEYMAAVDIRDDAVVVGAPAFHRSRSLLGRWIPMSQVLTGEALTAGPGSQTMFYAQAWLLVHYLHAERENLRDELGRYLTALNDGVDPVEAFESAFGMSVAGLTSALERYVRPGRVSALQFPRDLFPEPPDPPHRVLPRAEAAQRLGVLALQLKQVALAQYLFEVAVAADPTLSRAHAGLGDALKLQGLWDESEPHFERAVELGPDEFENHLDLAEYFHNRAQATAEDQERLELFKRARRAYVRSYQLNPNDPETYAMYGATYLHEGLDVERGIETLEHARSLLPSHLRIRLMLAQAYAAVDRIDDARALLESIVIWGHSEEERAAAEELLAGLDAGAAR